MYSQSADTDNRFRQLFENATDVLVLEFWNVKPQLEISVEIALRLDEKATYAHVGHLLPYSQGYRHSKAETPTEQRIIDILRTSGFGGKISSFESLFSSQDISVFPPFALPLSDLSFKCNKNFLEAFSVDCTAGRSVLASLIDIEKDQDVDISQHIGLAKLLLESYLTSFRITISLILENRDISHVVVFNGRFPETAGAADAANRLGRKVLFHERSYANEDEFSLTPYPVHDFSEIKSEVIRTCHGVERKDLMDSLRLFQGIAAGKSLLGVQFYGKKNLVRWMLGRIPIFRHDNSGSVPERKTVLFATCSDDEFFFSDSGCVKNPYSEWGDQKRAIKMICGLCVEQGYNFILRIHPHTSTKSYRVISEWVSLSKEVMRLGGFVYAPLDPTSIYSLIDKADVFITSASQSGIEACALGKPTLNIRDSRYNDIGCGAVKIKGLKELEFLLRDKNRLSSIVDYSKPELYSYWMTHQSYPFQNIRFKGKVGYLVDSLIRPEERNYLWARKINRLLRYLSRRLCCYYKGGGFVHLFMNYRFLARKRARRD